MDTIVPEIGKFDVRDSEHMHLRIQHVSKGIFDVTLHTAKPYPWSSALSPPVQPPVNLIRELFDILCIKNRIEAMDVYLDDINGSCRMGGRFFDRVAYLRAEIAGCDKKTHNALLDLAKEIDLRAHYYKRGSELSIWIFHAEKGILPWLKRYQEFVEGIEWASTQRSLVSDQGDKLRPAPFKTDS